MTPKNKKTASREGLSEAMEDLLKALLRMEMSGDEGGTTALGVRLGITPSAVSQGVGKLSEMGLLVRVKRGKPQLTEPGLRIAKEMLRHHRLLELFLTEALGYSWEEAHPEAERLEHHISEELEAAIDAHLGHPTHDPHGSPIPTPELEIEVESLVPLSSLSLGDKGVVRRVAGFDGGLLRHLKEIGLVPGAKFQVETLDPYGSGYGLRVEGAPGLNTLSVEAASKVGVETAQLRTLLHLSPGEEGVLGRVSGDPELVRRLSDMGAIQGEPIRFLRKAPMGDPLVFEVGGTRLSLRASEAKAIALAPK
ncbi:FeoA domain-containing protein [bacterium]|nr:FeoA domain-containing protein [bacterium]